MEKERRGIGTWLKERIHAISVAIGNLAARIILGKKGFNEAYQMNLKNSIAKDVRGKADAYKEQKMNGAEPEKQLNPLEQTEQGEVEKSMEKSGADVSQAERLYEMAKEHSAEIIKLMDKAAPELKENQDFRVELGNLDLIISKAGENGELKAVIQEKGQDGEIVMSSKDLESGNDLQHVQEAYLPAEDIEQHAKDEEILKQEEMGEEEQAGQDIFEGFLDEDVPADAPVSEDTFDVLDMNIQNAQESGQEASNYVADTVCHDLDR